jgi:hypothetical protein
MAVAGSMADLPALAFDAAPPLFVRGSLVHPPSQNFSKIWRACVMSNAFVDRRPEGRLPGSPRPAGAGRKKGVPNSVTAELREKITAAKPIEFLIKVCEGQRIRVGPQAGPIAGQFVYPSVEQRLRAAELLVKKILPDLTSSEITGANGAPLVPPAQPVSVEQLALTAITILERHKARTEAVEIEAVPESAEALLLLERHGSAKE